MEKSFNQVIAQLTEFLRGLTLKQKAILVGSALLVSATLFTFVHFINKPELKTLYSGLKPEEAKSMAARLEAKKISYTISPDGGSINVPAEELDAARLEATSEGVPHSGRMGFEIFDKPDWTGTDFTEKVNYQRALEGELERTIQTLSEVESARVHLVLPGESMFLDDQREAKASITLKLKGGRYGEETARAVSRLVSSAVDRLRPENVTVVDADTNQSLSGSTNGRISRGDVDVEQQLANTLIKTLEPVLGPEKARASVRIEYDPTSSEENQESYDPDKVVAMSMQKSEEVSGSKRVGGIPGTASNVPGSQSAQVVADRVDDGSQSSRTESGTYAVNKVLRHTIFPAGRIERINAALVVDDVSETSGDGGQKKEVRRKRTPEELKQIEEIAKAAVGIDPTRGDVLSVQNLSFLQTAVNNPAKPGALERTRKIVNDYSPLLKYGSILMLFLVVYLLLLRPLKRQVLDVLSSNGSNRSRLGGGRGGRNNDKAAEIEANSIDFGAIPAESRKAIALKQHLLEKVKGEPAAASRLVQSWMRQETSE